MSITITKTEMLKRYRDGISRNRQDDDIVLACIAYLDDLGESVELRDINGKRLSYERQLSFAYDQINSN